MRFDPLQKNEILGMWKEFCREEFPDKKHVKSFVYVHTPYCSSKCKFCMYESEPLLKEGALTEEKKFLLNEALETAEAVEGLEFDGLYFGGGTPTIYEEDDFYDVVSAVRSCFKLSGRAVSTCEMNPNSATSGKIKTVVEHGINRISLGIQTLTPKVLEIAGRQEAGLKKTAELVNFAKECGASVVNIDLLAPLPGETEKTFLETVEKASGLGADTVTLYCLQNLGQQYSPSEMAMSGESLGDWDRIKEIFTSGLAGSSLEILKESSKLTTCLIAGNSNNLYNEDNRYELHSRRPIAVLGLGRNSCSNLFGKVFYKNLGRSGAAQGFAAREYVGYRKDIFEEALDMLLLHLRDGACLSFQYFESVFGCDAERFARENFEMLIDRGFISFSSSGVEFGIKFADAPKFFELSKTIKQLIFSSKRRNLPKPGSNRVAGV